MLSSAYNVFRSTVIALNNSIQHSRCQVVQLFRSTPFSIKASTTIIPKLSISFTLALGGVGVGFLVGVGFFIRLREFNRINFYITLPSYEPSLVPVEMVQFLLKLLLKSLKYRSGSLLCHC